MQNQQAGVLSDRLNIDDFTTTVNTYVNLPIHYPEPGSGESVIWPTEKLGSKVFYFKAADNDLNIKILASDDGGETFPIIAKAETLVAVAAPVRVVIGNHYGHLKIQVKPAVEGAHGTLTASVYGSSVPSTEDLEISADTSGLATSAKQDTQITAEQAVQAMLEATRTISSAAVSASSSGDNTLIAAPGSGKQLWILKLFIAAARGSEVDMILKSGSTAKTGTMQIDSLAADLDFTPIKCGTNEAFVLNLSAAVAVAGIVLYRTVDV